MSKKLKVAILTALLLVVFGTSTIVFIACSKEKEFVVESDSEFVNPMNIVGEYHNKGLEYLINKFPYSGFTNKSIQDTIAMVTTLVTNFRNSLPSGHIFNNGLVNYKDIDEKVSKQIIDYRINPGKSARNKLSEKQQIFLKRLEDILRNKNEVDSVKVIKNVLVLEIEIYKSDMTNEEKNSTLLAVAVGKYSWKFWSQNRFSKTKSGLGMDGPFRDTVVRCDIEAAIGGAIIGCIGGAIGGSMIMPGVGTLSACMVEAVSAGFQAAIVGSFIGALSYLIFD